MQHSFTTFKERGKTGQDGGEAQLPLSVPPQLPTTTSTPQLLQMKRWGEENREQEPQKTQSHSHSYSFRYRPVILRGITNGIAGLNLISLLFMVIYNIHQIIYSMNQITLGEHEHAKYCGSAPQPARRQQGQLIWRRANSSGKKYIYIMGWLFPLLVWHRPSSSSCGKGLLIWKIVKEKISEKA